MATPLISLPLPVREPRTEPKFFLVHSAAPTLQTPLEIPFVMIQLLRRHRLLDLLSQPVLEPRRGGQLLFEFFGYRFSVHIQIFAQEFADFCVLVVADEGSSVFGIGGIDIYVDG